MGRLGWGGGGRRGGGVGMGSGRIEKVGCGGGRELMLSKDCGGVGEGGEGDRGGNKRVRRRGGGM